MNSTCFANTQGRKKYFFEKLRFLLIFSRPTPLNKVLIKNKLTFVQFIITITKLYN